MTIGGVVYILINHGHSTLYTSFASNIVKRLYEHRNGAYKKALRLNMRLIN